MVDRPLLKTVGILAVAWFGTHAAGLTYTLVELQRPGAVGGQHGIREVAAVIVAATTAPAGLLAMYLVPGAVSLSGHDATQMSRRTELVSFWVTASILGFLQWALLVGAFLTLIRHRAERSAPREP